MVTVAQINVIVADLERSRAFYEWLGIAFTTRSRTGEPPAEAWVSVDTGVTIVLHSTGFASWWDESHPQPAPGEPQIDLQVDSDLRVDELAAGVVAAGGSLIKPPADMPWRQRFAIIGDPDGHRIGLKGPPAVTP